MAGRGRNAMGSDRLVSLGRAAMWLFTVASLRYSRAAISALVRPLATSLTISSSRPVSCLVASAGVPSGEGLRQKSSIRRRVTDGASNASPAGRGTHRGGQLVTAGVLEQEAA